MPRKPNNTLSGSDLEILHLHRLRGHTSRVTSLLLSPDETLPNERDRQTYYGAFNLWTKEFIVHPYSAGNGENTVKFIQKIKSHHPEQKSLLIWDGASYHRGEEVKKLLATENEGKAKEDWSIICHLFAPYAPQENPVEEIWRQVKNFIRCFYYICKSFS